MAPSASSKAKGKSKASKAKAAQPAPAGAAAAAAAAAAPAASASAHAVAASASSAHDAASSSVPVWMTGRALPSMYNTAEQQRARDAAANGRFFTRFPPEPNGHLHIGHAKAMHFNFKTAKANGGGCYLRMDDTNPSVERDEYIRGIHENCAWLGHKPMALTASSDYFQELYDLAVELIKRGLAYVCHLSQEEVKMSRKMHVDSPYRTRSVAENLRLFDDMRRGRFGEGEAVLRMKGDMQHDNANMWDHVAYRVMFEPHPKTGAAWCIYPSYDFSHCLVDSLEHISASCCTLEFENRRESYFWLLDVLDLYKPVVFEFSRLNISNSVMSKRKLRHLVFEGLVRGWDDPRLLTLSGLRRRGFTADAVNDLCEKVGVSRVNNTTEEAKLFACLRDDLENKAPRSFAVFDPVRLVFTNWDKRPFKDEVETVACPDFPQDRSPAATTHAQPFSRVVFLDRGDFEREDPGKKYYGMAPGKAVRLKYAHIVTCTGFKPGADDRVEEIYAEVDWADELKVKKGNLSWVAEAGASPCEFRLYSSLLKADATLADDDDEEDAAAAAVSASASAAWLSQLNPDSETVSQGFVPPFVAAAAVEALKEGRKMGDLPQFQFERFGYFVMDPDATPEKLVFNRSCELRASK